MSLSRGVATALAGAWRWSPPDLQMTVKELAAITPLMVASGAGALCWWRLRGFSDQVDSITKERLQNAYRYNTLQAALHEHQVAEVFRVLRRVAVEPVLLKGWAASRLYPESGLRPSGDIDLCVAPEKYEAARNMLNRPENRRYWVDLDHIEITTMDGRSFEDLYRRSELVKLGDAEVRIFGPEDHLRILCFHFVKHGAYRPLWLCDIVAALESRPLGFDWDRCLRGSKHRARWVLCTLALANRFLGAKFGDTPVIKELPAWLCRSVLKQWEKPYPPSLPLISNDIMRHWREPAVLLKHLCERWPNPVQATVDHDGDFTKAPRLPFQICNYFGRGLKLLKR